MGGGNDKKCDTAEDRGNGEAESGWLWRRLTEDVVGGQFEVNHIYLSGLSYSNAGITQSLGKECLSNCFLPFPNFNNKMNVISKLNKNP